MRPFMFITVGYITGILWGLYLKMSIVPIFFIFFLVGFVIIKLNIVKNDLVRDNKNIILLFAIFAILSNIRILNLEKRYDILYKDIEINQITGTIISSKNETTYRESYILQVQNINGNAKYKNTNLIIYTKKETNLKYGDNIKLKGKYEQASKRTNYKAFDYREYLKSKNIYGIVQVENIEKLKENNLISVNLVINNIQEKIKTNLNNLLGSNGSIANGILLRRYF